MGKRYPVGAAWTASNEKGSVRVWLDIRLPNGQEI